MRNLFTIASREYKLYFASPAAYIIAFVLMLVLGIFFYLNLQFISVQPGYVPGADITIVPLATMLVLVTPAITTRLIAEERRLGTIELLLTAPVRDWELVVGKWLGGFFLLLTIIAITFIYPAMLNQFVDPGIDQGPLITGYLGLALLSASLVAIGVLVSSFFSNQIAAFVATMGVMIFLWWVLGPIVQVMGPVASNAEWITYLDFNQHFFNNLLRGVIDLKDITYFVSLTALALFFGTVSVETGRWS